MRFRKENDALKQDKIALELRVFKLEQDNEKLRKTVIDTDYKGCSNYITWKVYEYITDQIEWNDQEEILYQSCSEIDGVNEMIDEYKSSSTEFQCDLEEYGRRSINCCEIAQEIHRLWVEYQLEHKKEDKDGEEDEEDSDSE